MLPVDFILLQLLAIVSSQIAFVSGAGSCSYTYTAPVDYILQFEENFDGPLTTLTQKWKPWVSGAYNNELQCYQQSALSFNNGIMSIAVGSLLTQHQFRDMFPSSLPTYEKLHSNCMLQVARQTVTCPKDPYSHTTASYDFTSGRIETKQLFGINSTYPRIRIVGRMQLPLGKFMWGAFWSYGDPWPTQGEIDILESRGQEPLKYQTNYFYGKSRNNPANDPSSSAVVTSDVDLTTCFHTYELIWEKTKLIYLLDGVPVVTKYDSSTTSGSQIGNLFGKLERIVLNVAVGGNFFSNVVQAEVVPGTMLVDWVRVYASTKSS